jgi:hypothetical protein
LSLLISAFHQDRLRQTISVQLAAPTIGSLETSKQFKMVLIIENISIFLNRPIEPSAVFWFLRRHAPTPCASASRASEASAHGRSEYVMRHVESDPVFGFRYCE